MVTAMVTACQKLRTFYFADFPRYRQIWVRQYEEDVDINTLPQCATLAFSPA